MASVTVFVDDAVQGRLPNVCVATGMAADRRIRFHERVRGGSPAVFLLFFLGPPGWIVALLLLGGGEHLDVLLPVSDETTERWRRLRHQRVAACVAMAVSFLLLVTRHRGVATWVLLGATAAWALAAHVRLLMDGVGIELDASRRWVTLKGVDRDFVAAVRAEEARVS